MSGYAKLFGSILQSTIWEEDPETKVVWITMLALSDRHGEVMASIPGLARSAQVSLAACERALKKFKATDKYSRTKDEGGRRIEDIDGGWLIINFDKYRQMAGREDQLRKHADRQKRYRERLRVTSRVTHSDGQEPPSPSPSPSPAPEQIRSGVGSAPLSRPGAGPRARTADKLVAGTDAKLAELRAAADRQASPEEIAELSKLRQGNGAA